MEDQQPEQIFDKYAAIVQEEICNLFAFFEAGSLASVGIVVHRMSGSDAEKTAYLQANAVSDHGRAICGRLIKPISVEHYAAMVRLGTAFELFWSLLDHVGAPPETVTCITSIIDGKPIFHATVQGYGPIDLLALPEEFTGRGIMDDYLTRYVNGSSFDMPRLIKDDYFSAIQLLFNKGHYVSGTKLLMSFLDTVAFIETGEVLGNFISWLKCYADLGIVGITEEELWELRNGLLHMTNLDSQKVLKGKHARLVPYVGDCDIPPSTSADSKYFNLFRLLEAVTKALENWIATYNKIPSKMLDFVARYDRIVSDSRMAVITLD